MGIGAIFSLIMGILFIILGILAINHYRLHPEKEKALISTFIYFRDSWYYGRYYGLYRSYRTIVGYNCHDSLYLL